MAGAAPGAAAEAAGCEECVRTGGRWVHLRECLGCGHVGCCDSSPGQHAYAHAQLPGGHDLARSIEPGEDWAWCYADELFLRRA
ncbi:UBP-type zinc finger domain-containing protein [Streptacidiphilus sp. PAMC 29251]